MRKRNEQPPSIPVCHSEKEKCCRYSAGRPLPHPDKSPSSWSLGSGGRMQPLPTSPAAPAFRLFLPAAPRPLPRPHTRPQPCVDTGASALQADCFSERPLSATTRLPWRRRTRTEKAKTGLIVPVARKFWPGGRWKNQRRKATLSAEVGSYEEQTLTCYCA